jgi:hypothetical protein
MTRGIRNNDPLNIRHGKSQWTGMSKVQTDKTFVQFTSRVYGYRAAFIILRNYISRGKDTIGKIIAKWAPSADGNTTPVYIRYVSRSTGIGASHPLRIDDKDALIAIVQSMAHMESGIIEERSVIEQGYEVPPQPSRPTPALPPGRGTAPFGVKN